MKTIPIPPLNELERIVEANEANIYRWYDFAVKILHITYGPVFNNKMFVLSSLFKYRELIDIPELILPDALASRKGKIKGYLSEFVEGPTLEVILLNPNIDITIKIECIKKVGLILQKMHERRKIKELKDFYINDLHSGNLIIEKRTGNVRVGDMDAAHISGNRYCRSKYIIFNDNLQTLPEKYRPKPESSYSKDLIADENTEYYCYTIILLSALTMGPPIYSWSIKSFYDFLEHMAGLGASKNLLDILAKIYTNEDNEDFTPFLDEVPQIYKRLREKPFSR